MKVLKAKITSITSSFRYPQIMVGKIPTFEMPPPATIYGHLCGILGEWFDQTALQFSYNFKYKSRCYDKELIHVVGVAGGKYEYDGQIYKKNIEGNTNVQNREFLFDTEMILYLKGDDDIIKKLYDKFGDIEYSYILGRSQDLATCQSYEIIEIEESKICFFENTLLPWDFRKKTVKGFPIMMPKYVDYNNYRQPVFERYLQISKGEILVYPSKDDFIFIENEEKESFFTDKSEIKMINGNEYYKGLYFHGFK